MHASVISIAKMLQSLFANSREINAVSTLKHNQNLVDLLLWILTMQLS